jgi:competence protein ComEC
MGDRGRPLTAGGGTRAARSLGGAVGRGRRPRRGCGRGRVGDRCGRRARRCGAHGRRVVARRVGRGGAGFGAGARPVGARGALLAGGRARVEALAGRRNPGGFDARAHHRRHGVRAALSVVRTTERGVPGPAARARDALRRGTVAGLEGPRSALMQALTLGLRDDLGPLRDVFAASGHGARAGAVGPARGRARRWPDVAVGGRWGDAAARRGRGAARVRGRRGAHAGRGAGDRDGRVRAPRARLRVRRRGLGQPPGARRGGSLLARPGWLGDLGFQLSYLSVLGMGAAAGPLAARLVGRARGARTRRAGAWRAGAPGRRRPWRWAGSAIAVSVTAQWATLLAGRIDVRVDARSRRSPTSSRCRWRGGLVPLGFAAGVVGLGTRAPPPFVNRATGPWPGLLAAGRGGRRRRPAVGRGLVGRVRGVRARVAGAPGRAARGVAPVACGHRRRAAGLRDRGRAAGVGAPDLIALDVGQGDATWWVARGQAVLVDGGGTPFSDFDVGARIVVPALRALGVGRAAGSSWRPTPTPTTSKGSGGAARLPGRGLVSGHPAPERRRLRRLVAVAAARGVPVREVRRGDRSASAARSLDVLHPTHRPRARRTTTRSGCCCAGATRRGRCSWATRRPRGGGAAGAAHAAAARAPPRLGLEHVGGAAAGGPAAWALGVGGATTATATRRRACWRGWRRTGRPCAPPATRAPCACRTRCRRRDGGPRLPRRRRRRGAQPTVGATVRRTC